MQLAQLPTLYNGPGQTGAASGPRRSPNSHSTAPNIYGQIFSAMDGLALAIRIAGRGRRVVIRAETSTSCPWMC